MRPEMGNAVAGLAGGISKGSADAKPAPVPSGAVHSAEIEYALGNLATNKVYAWTKDDYKVSDVMLNYFANFIKTGNPNGAGLGTWSPAQSGTTAELALFRTPATAEQVMHIDVKSEQKPDRFRERYIFLEQKIMK